MSNSMELSIEFVGGIYKTNKTNLKIAFRTNNSSQNESKREVDLRSQQGTIEHQVQCFDSFVHQ